MTCGSYLFCPTCERVGPVRVQKIRGMLIRKEFLNARPKEEPSDTSPTHVSHHAA